MAMVVKSSTNSYEEARIKRLEDNKKRFRELGILKINEDLSELMKSHQPQKKPWKHVCYKVGKPRRSTRERNPIVLYAEEYSKKRLKVNPTGTRYTKLQKPLHETSLFLSTDEKRARAIKHAGDFLENLQNPSFIKSMVPSHLCNQYLMTLPSRFFADHLPKTVSDMVLEDENNAEYEVTYNGANKNLSHGWKEFVVGHKVTLGDALVFEMIGSTRFKVYIFKASQILSEEDDVDAKDDDDGTNDNDDDDNKFKEDLATTSSPECGTDASTKLVDSDQQALNLPRRSQ